MTKNYYYALFSLECYNNQDDNDLLPPSRIPQGWEIFHSFIQGPNDSDYFGRAYIHRQSQKLIIAHRGTEPTQLGDLESDFQLALSRVPEQYSNSAKLFNAEVKYMFTQEFPTLSFEESTTFTGHSLGAVLAELSAAENSIKVVSFESPGSQSIIANMIENQLLSSQALEFMANNAIIFNAAPNAVSTTNLHTGTIYRAYPPYTTLSGNTDQPGNTFYALQFSFMGQHSMRNLFQQFIEDIDFPRTYSEPTTWPVGTLSETSGYNYYKNYDENPYYWEAYMQQRWEQNPLIALTPLQTLYGNDFKAYRAAFMSTLNHTPNASQQPGVFITGDDSGNTIFGTTAKQDTIVSGIGDDIVYDFGGDDLYTDTGGANQYHFIHSLFGNDTITDPGTFRLFIDGFEFKGYAIQPRGEMVTRYAATHKNGQVYELEHVGIDLTIRPSGETRYIKLTNFRPHQLNVGLGEQTMQKFISIPSDDVPWDGYVNQLNCLERGPVYVTTPSGTATGRIVGSPQNDILSVGTGGRATSAFDKIELWGCGGKDKLYANDNNTSRSAAA